MHPNEKQQSVIFDSGIGGSGPASASRLGQAHVAYLDLAAKVERRKLEGQNPTPVYRVYLRDRAGNAVSGHTIAVAEDETAVEVASVLCHASRDVCVTFEIWKGETLFVVRGVAVPPPTREERTQQIVVEREIAIRATRTESQVLLDGIDEWQATPRRRRSQ